MVAVAVSRAEAGWFVGPLMTKIINACYDYLKDQVGWQTGMKKKLESLRKNHPKIQAVVLAANQAQISDQNHPINKWIWELRDALDEVNDVLDELEYMKHKEQLPKNTEETKKRKVASILFEATRKILKIGKRGLKRDPKLKRLEEAVQKLVKVSSDVTTFLHLLDIAKKEHKDQKDSSSSSVLNLWTDAPGVQFYIDNYVNGVSGKEGSIYQKDASLCLKTQGFPNAINQPNFPNIVIQARKKYKHKMLFDFSTE